jgi:flagella basal body P-ring formation protein FlgA
MMTRVFTALIAVMLLAGPAFADPTLKPSATITGDTILVGDLFADAGAAAKDPVAAAPAIGQRVTYGAAWLAAAAQEHHVNWTPGSDFDQVSVERATRGITADTVSARLLSEIAIGPDAANTDLQLDNPGLRFVVPAEASDAMAIDGLTVDPRSGRFSAFVSAPAGAPDAQRQRVTGRVIYQTDLAVPNRAVAMGDVLAAGDIERIKLPRDRIASDTIVDAAQLVGKSARHALRAEQPVRAGDVQDPVVVHKGDLVSIEIVTDTMQLSAQGKSLDDGAMGANIRVTNTQSSRVVDATVVGPNRVTVGTPDRVASR